MNNSSEILILQQKLFDIKNLLDNALIEYDKLFVLTKKSILVDDEVDGYDEFKIIEKKLNNVRNNLVNEIIPKVNDKL